MKKKSSEELITTSTENIEKSTKPITKIKTTVLEKSNDNGVTGEKVAIAPTPIEQTEKSKPISKSEFKAQLKEAKNFYQLTKKALKKTKRTFKLSSKKRDEQQYQIAKFNFTEAKLKKKEQKLQLKMLKKMKKVFRKNKKN